MQHVQVKETLVPFKTRILAALPGKSLNKRIYTKELLQRIAPLYEGRPFIMDHDIEHAERTIGVFGNPRYATERGMDGRSYEGLWLDGVGRMDKDLFEKAEGSGLVPPLVRGFSIGGWGEGEAQDDGILITKFVPIEGSLTTFPGIAQAHLATIEMIRESLRTQGHEVKKTSIPVKETEVSLEEAEKQAAKIRESAIPDQDTGTGTRQRNDVRPGLPSPGRGKPVSHQQPQTTTSADTGLNINPEQHSSGSAPVAATGSKGPATSKEAGPRPKSPDAQQQPAGQVSRPEPGRDAPARGNKFATPQLSGTVTAPGQPSDKAPVTVMTTQAETDDSANDDEEDDEDDVDGDTEERGMRRKWKTTTTTDQSGEEEYEDTESQKMQIRQDDEPIGVTKDKQPMAHPGEEEDGKENPILRTAGVSQHANTNPTKEESLPPTDVVPIQARAYSLPIDTGIYQAALRFDKLRNPDRTKEAEEYINAWNEAKKPPEQPVRRVRIRASKKSQVQESTVSFQNSLIDTIKPTRSPRDNSLLAPRTSQAPAQQDPSSVPTRSVTNTAPAPAPMYAAIGASTLSATVSEVLEKTRKEPFGMYNLAGRTWRKMLPELLEVR